MELHLIEQICRSQGGIKKISLTTVDNILKSYNPSVIDDDKVYTMYFRRKTGGYTEETEDSRHNQKIIQKLHAFVPQKRLSMELMITKLINKRIVAIFETFDGSGGMLYAAKFNYKYQTGTSRSSDQGYNCEFISEKVIGSLDYTGVDIELPDPGDPFYNPNPGVQMETCCISIEPQQIQFVPLAEGNEDYLNHYVVAPNGVKYFIDKWGRAMAFPSFPEYHESWTGITDDEIVVTSGVIPTTDPSKKIFIFKNNLKLEYSIDSPPPDERYFTTVDNKIKFNRALYDWEVISLYAIPNY
jgi:hypothetical protein